MKISVIVPVYNVEPYIKKCLDSIVNQTMKDIEIIVVNDGTKDKSIDIIKKNFHDKRLKIYDKVNGGLASARNYGIEKATGDYLFFVDSDDFIDIGCLEDMSSLALANDSDVVICDYYKYFENGNKEHINMIPFYEEDNHKCHVTSMPGAVGKLIKASIFKKYNLKFLENHYFEDNAIMPFACAVAPKFDYLNKAYYYYLQRDGSILNQQKYNPKWEDIFDSLDYLSKLFDKHQLKNEYYDELEYIYIEYLLHAANLKFIGYPEAYDNIIRVSKVMKETFPKWKHNKYLKKSSLKYRIMCHLFYHKQIRIISLLRRHK